MFETIFNWVNLILVLLGAIAGAVPAVIALIKAIKARKLAKTEAEAEKAYNDMREQLDMFIREAEEAYKDVDRVLKQNGSSAGALKKQTVLNNLQQLAFDKGYSLDKEFWSEKIDDVVAFTKKINGKIQLVTTNN